MSVTLKCRKCRIVICREYSKLAESEVCDASRLLFEADDVPTWIQSTLKECSYMRGKLHCPKCSAKVGSFDFTSSARCDCGKDHSNIWLVSSKVDIVHYLAPSSSTPQPEDNASPPVPRLQAKRYYSYHPKLLCSEEDLKALQAIDCRENDATLLQNDALELSKKKVSEVALSLTRKGRECVAHLCAGLSVDAHLGESSGQKRRPTPATSDEETDASTNDVGAQSLQPLINSAFSDALQLSEDERSRESSPSIVKQSSFKESSDEEQAESNAVSAEPFTCSVCLEIYYLPQSCSPCEHVFCDPCLRQVNGSAAGGDVKCPLCRKVIKKCSTAEDLWKATKVLFPAEYQERHKLERKKRKHRPSLPGSTNGRYRANRRANGGGSNVLAMWAGVCFVILFMMLGFTVFATTVGFVAWYFLEVAMDLLVDVTLEFQTFSDIFKTSIILFCIDGRLSDEKWRQLYDSAGRVLGAFTKLVQTKNASHNLPAELPLSSHQEDSGKPYHTLWKITQTNLANYVVFGCLVTFIMYRLAKFMQARRA